MSGAPSRDPPEPGRVLRARATRARNVADLRAAARRRLPRGVFDFVDGGAEDEATLAANAAAYRGRALVPRVLRDVSAVDLTTPILGTPARLPVAVGPTGGLGFVWPRGDLAVARAAHAAGVPFTLATTSDVSIEDLRAGADGRLWMQTYIFRQRDVTHRMIERARAAAFEALVITVDLPVGGNRERDHRNDFSVPFRLTPRNALDFARHPEWVVRTLRAGMPTFGNLRDFRPDADAAKAASTVGRNYDAAFDWDDLAGIRDLWGGKLVVKGVAHPADAERLDAMGVDAIVASNHGGRQLDGAAATLDTLARLRGATRGPLWVDGGVRRGSDVLKALALGADAVLIGRATLYGVAAAGEAGARRALAILEEELGRAMRLCGLTTIDAIDGDVLAVRTEAPR